MKEFESIGEGMKDFDRHIDATFNDPMKAELSLDK